MTVRPRRAVSSGTFVGLSPEARAGLHASEQAPALLEAVETATRGEVDARVRAHQREHLGPLVDALERALGVELAGDAHRLVRALLAGALRDALLAGADTPDTARRAVRAVLGDWLRRAYLAGTELEVGYRTALDAATAIRDRLEALLRAHGIVVPTTRAPSEPPAQ